MQFFNDTEGQIHFGELSILFEILDPRACFTKDFLSNSKLKKTTKHFRHYSLINIYLISMKFDKCTHTITVGACAKFCSDVII